jgi:hypothetical protein
LGDVFDNDNAGALVPETLVTELLQSGVVHPAPGVCGVVVPSGETLAKLVVVDDTVEGVNWIVNEADAPGANAALVLAVHAMGDKPELQVTVARLVTGVAELMGKGDKGQQVDDQKKKKHRGRPPL